MSAGGAAAVVNTQLTGTIVLPAASWAPETVAVYDVDAVSGFDGAKVTERLPNCKAFRWA